MAGKRDDLEIVIGADLSGLASDLSRAAQMAKGMSREIERSAPRTKDFAPRVDTSGLARYTRAAKDAEGASKGAGGGMLAFAGKAGVVGAAILAVTSGVNGLSSALDLVKESVGMAAELKQTTLAFEVMLGSAERATSTLGNLRKFAAETPFGSAETIGAARQLKAYGIEADQLLPTLRVLGDVTAGLGGETKLKDMAYLFGTLASQGRAFSKDIYQFTNRGVDLLPGLAKELGVTKAEVMGLVEAGRVGFPEVARALESLRGPGGQFENLMKRQSETLGGLAEQLKDAFDLGKIKLGQIIIEETGLKDAVKDIDAFTKRTSDGLDRIRPFVRFMGDLGRSTAQVGYELGKAAALAAEFDRRINGDVTQKPWLKELINDIQEFVRSGKDFRIDPRGIADVVFVLSDELHNLFLDLLRNLNAVGMSLDKNVVQVIRSGVAEIFRVYSEGREIFGKQTVEEKFHPPRAFESSDTVRARYRELFGELQSRKQRFLDYDILKEKSATFNPEGALRRHLELGEEVKRYEAIERQFLRGFGGGEHFPAFRHELLKTDQVPRLAGSLPPLVGERSLMSELEERVKASQRGNVDRHRRLTAELDAQAAAKAAEEANKLAESLRLAREQLTPFGTAFALGPFGVLAEPARDRDRQLQMGAFSAIGGGLGGVGATGAARGGSQLLFKHEPSSTHAEIAKSVRDKYDPLDPNGKLMSFKKNLDEAFNFKELKITPEMRDLAWRDAVSEVADSLGLNKPSRLPDTVLAGSQEDARLLSSAMGGQQQQTTDDLLRRIENIMQRSYDKLSDLERGANKPVAVDAAMSILAALMRG